MKSGSIILFSEISWPLYQCTVRWRVATEAAVPLTLVVVCFAFSIWRTLARLGRRNCSKEHLETEFYLHSLLFLSCMVYVLCEFYITGKCFSFPLGAYGFRNIPGVDRVLFHRSDECLEVTSTQTKVLGFYNYFLMGPA